MNSITIIEFLLIGIIVVFQTSLALRTRKQIRFLAEIIPALKFFKLRRFNIPLEDLHTFEPKEILQNLSAYEQQPKPQPAPVYAENGNGITDLFTEVENGEYEKQDEVSLINPSEEINPIFDEILVAINVYLLRNKGAATDFNLIKDVVERNLDMEEEDISHTVTVPLYLGLMGTMVGIVFGLIHLFIVSGPDADFDIKAFLGGVSIAMFASFWGLFCTVTNSSYNLKRARRKLEKAKNNFYTFVQTELLPVLNQSVSSSIYSLHENLVRFNNNFTLNLNRLSGLLNKNHDALIAQEKILQAVESIQPKEFAEANIVVLKELKTSTKQLEKFNVYLNSLNYLVNGTTRLTTSFEDLLTRSNNFHGLGEKLDNRVEVSNKLLQFLSDHFVHLEQRGEIIRDSVVKVEDIMIKSLNQLEAHTQEKIEAIRQNANEVEEIMIRAASQIEEHTQAKIEVIKQNANAVEEVMMKAANQIEEYTQAKIEAIKKITEKEEDLLSQAFAENKSHISKLSLLEDLKKSIEEIKMSSAGQIRGMQEQLNSLRDSLEKSNSELSQINQKIPVRGSFIKVIKSIFQSKPSVS